MNHSGLSEKMLNGCRNGERNSQKELYQRFYSYGMSIALRYASSRQEAGSILNDTFLKVFDNLHRYDPSRDFKPWFRTILVRTAINRFHQRRKEPDWQPYHDELLRDEPGQPADNGITGQEIMTMVQQLPLSYRTVFNLYVIEGYTHKEIAELLGIQEGTSKSNLFKAKRELRSMLEKNLYT